MSKIQKKTVKTKNIRESMQTYAQDNFTPLGECDFTINNIDTYIKTTASSEFELFNEDVNTTYKDKDKILNEHVEFQQLYTITARAEALRKIELNYSIDFGEFSANPKIIIHPDSKIPYKNLKPKEVYILLIRELNKIKAKYGILVGIFDTSMLNTLKKFVKHIYEGKFTKRIRIPLFEGVEPEITKASTLIMHFKNKESNERVIEVESGEVLVEFIKPFFGKNGLNAYGMFIDSGYGDNKHDLDADIDSDSIIIKEDEKKKLYKSKKRGFVTFIDKKLTVNNKVQLSKLSRVENSVTKEEVNNIEVHVSQNDTTKDSIGAGVELTSETIHVNGHIGANSILEAVNLQVDGATHQDSTQFARTAKINRHKGTLRCHNAKIALLEGGEVHATNVEIEASLGGTIYAQDVTIGHVKNNLKVYASNSIKIRLVSGEDNIFKINYKDIPILNSKIDLIQDDIEELKYSLEEAKRHNISQVDPIKKKIRTLTDERNIIKSSSKDATITIEKPFIGLNTIIFTLNSGDDLIYKTSPREYEPFYLELNEDKITLHPVNKTITLN